MKAIRFRLYDLEKAFFASMQRTFSPSLYVIIDERYASRYKIEYMVRLLIRHGATMIQLRAQELSDRMFVRTGMRIRRTLMSTGVRFIINNRVDIALACGADGVHLGQRDMPVVRARQIMGEHAILGVSAHSVQQARRAEKQGADYLGFGAVYPTMTKADAHVRGLSVLKAVCAATRVPVIGIGGITSKNCQRVLTAGAAGIAVCSFIFEGNVRQNMRALTQKRG
jgi:thiamine-phosphate pyrophosphorylase